MAINSLTQKKTKPKIFDGIPLSSKNSIPLWEFYGPGIPTFQPRGLGTQNSTRFVAPGSVCLGNGLGILVSSFWCNDLGARCKIALLASWLWHWRHLELFQCETWSFCGNAPRLSQQWRTVMINSWRAKGRRVWQCSVLPWLKCTSNCRTRTCRK